MFSACQENKGWPGARASTPFGRTFPQTPADLDLAVRSHPDQDPSLGPSGHTSSTGAKGLHVSPTADWEDSESQSQLFR